MDPDKSTSVCSFFDNLLSNFSFQPCHPTTRSAEAYNERSLKTLKIKSQQLISDRTSKELQSGSGRMSKEAEVIPKESAEKPTVQEEKLPIKLPKMLSKEEHREQVRDMLRARKRFLGELPDLPSKALDELKPVVRTLSFFLSFIYLVSLTISSCLVQKSESACQPTIKMVMIRA
jgi:hypothetical protein